MNTPTLTALVVHESMFHNTATVAEVVAASLTAEGMSVTCVDVADAPPLESVEADLLVVGAPTHAFSLSRPGTREEAVRQGAPAEHARTGVREWLAAAPSSRGETRPRGRVRHPGHEGEEGAQGSRYARRTPAQAPRVHPGTTP